MKRITYGFRNGQEERCHCPKPCVRRHFEIRRWKQYGHVNKNDTQVSCCKNTLFAE